MWPRTYARISAGVGRRDERGVHSAACGIPGSGSALSPGLLCASPDIFTELRLRAASCDAWRSWLRRLARLLREAAGKGALEGALQGGR